METLTAFTKGVILELDSNIKVTILDSYAIDTKNIRIIAIAEDLDIYILEFNLNTNEFSHKYQYDTVSIVAAMRKV